MPLPDEAGRHAILALHAKRLSVEIEEEERDEDDEAAGGGGRGSRPAGATDEDPLRLLDAAAGTEGFSGAELANLVNEAALLAVREGKSAVCARNFHHAMYKVRFLLKTLDFLLKMVDFLLTLVDLLLETLDFY